MKAPKHKSIEIEKLGRDKDNQVRSSLTNKEFKLIIKKEGKSFNLRDWARLAFEEKLERYGRK